MQHAETIRLRRKESSHDQRSNDPPKHRRRALVKWHRLHFPVSILGKLHQLHTLKMLWWMHGMPRRCCCHGGKVLRTGKGT